MRAVQVALDGRRLGRLVQLLAHGLLTVSVDDSFPLERAGAALARSRRGAHGSATVLRTGAPGEDHVSAVEHLRDPRPRRAARRNSGRDTQARSAEQIQLVETGLGATAPPDTGQSFKPTVPPSTAR
jgi:hypothetical protein